MQTPLGSLEQNVLNLIQQHRNLSELNEALAEQNERLRDEMMRTHAELVELQRKYKRLQSAYTLSGNTEQRNQAKRQITKLIDSIDKALAELRPLE